MSLFDYPRINFQGTIQLNPGTANNDDYAQQPAALLPASYGPPYGGQPLGLIKSKTVQARTFGMSDAAFIAWVQKAQTFDTPGGPNKTAQIIPAEWNYYGDMASTGLKIAVVGVQAGPDKCHTDVHPGTPLTSAIGATVTYSGHITDVNSEGSPPATQFFIDTLTVQKGGQILLQGKGTVSKGACQWLNFYRNVSLTADGGSGGYVYHVIKKGDDTTIDIPEFKNNPNVVGVICRYYLYRRAGGASRNADIEKLYEQKKTNPAELEIVGTFAPLMKDEEITTGPVGRLMVCDVTNIPTPPNTQNNGNNGLIALAPAVLQLKGNTVSADFSGTFPDYFQNGANPKYDFGPVMLMVSNATSIACIAQVDYADTKAGDARGWIFDFDISSNKAAQQILADPEARFSLQHPQYGTVLAETDYYFVSNQQGIYAEQNGPGDLFLNQGAAEPATVSVYHRGRPLGAGECPSIDVWQYRTVPIQSPGDVRWLATNFQPGQPLTIDTKKAGNFLFTFSIGQPPGFPPKNYGQFMFPPYLTNAPSISLRILPNDEDFSKYYDPKSDPKDPKGNDELTFDVVYQKVLRTYYLLYPAMNKVFPLNSETEVAKRAKAILAVTDPDPKNWMSAGYMPRTRDMSKSRRTLLRAWCWKVIAEGKGS